jgi:hypothetical protein
MCGKPFIPWHITPDIKSLWCRSCWDEKLNGLELERAMTAFFDKTETWVQLPLPT